MTTAYLQTRIGRSHRNEYRECTLESVALYKSTDKVWNKGVTFGDVVFSKAPNLTFYEGMHLSPKISYV